VVRDAELVDRVASSTGLTSAEAARVVDDVIAWYSEPVDDYVKRRHALIAEELSGRLAPAPSLSERKLRRMIYGG
jgi:hypothetical protein